MEDPEHSSEKEEIGDMRAVNKTSTDDMDMTNCLLDTCGQQTLEEAKAEEEARQVFNNMTDTELKELLLHNDALSDEFDGRQWAANRHISWKRVDALIWDMQKTTHMSANTDYQEQQARDKIECQMEVNLSQHNNGIEQVMLDFVKLKDKSKHLQAKYVMSNFTKMMSAELVMHPVAPPNCTINFPIKKPALAELGGMFGDDTLSTDEIEEYTREDGPDADDSTVQHRVTTLQAVRRR